VEELIHAKAQEVGEVGVETRQSTAHAWREEMVNPPTLAEHPPHKFLGPTAITRIELCRAPIKGSVEQESGAEIREGIGGGDASVGNEREGRWHTRER
jgi:hypothetical protein